MYLDGSNPPVVQVVEVQSVPLLILLQRIFFSLSLLYLSETLTVITETANQPKPPETRRKSSETT